MKYFKLYFLVFLIVQSFYSYSLEVLFGYCPFKDICDKSYVELYFKVPSWELTPTVDSQNHYKVQSAFTIIISKDSQIVYADKFILNSKLENDTLQFNYFLLDVHRLVLKEGTYQIKIDYHDANNPTEFGSQVYLIQVPSYDYKISMSGIELLASVKKDSNQVDAFHKNGLYIEPIVLEFYPDHDTSMQFYTEVYVKDSTGLDNVILIRTKILDQNKKAVNGLEYYKRYKPNAVIPFIGFMDLRNLVSGNYFLDVSVLTKSSEVLHSTQLFFQRLNFGIEDTGLFIMFDSLSNRNFASNRFDTCSKSWLQFQVLMLAPLVEQSIAADLQKITKVGDIKTMKDFILTFWSKTNPSHPLETWLSYESKVIQAESNFATKIEHGFQTDRGRIFLKYGPTNNIINNREVGSLDYEIWHYYKLDGLQSNIRYVFYNPTLLYNGMVLLHSNARGEKNDPNWKQKIYRDYNGPGMQNIDDTDFQKHSGSQLERAISY